jgi:hypothetical protein
VGRTTLRAIDEQHSGLGPTGLVASRPSVRLESGTQIEWIESIAVSANYFDVLGVRASRGRLFKESDTHDQSRPVVLSFQAWRKRFGGDPEVIGRSIQFGASTFMVVGVLGRDFLFPVPSTFARTPELVTLLAPASATSTSGAA